MTKAPKVSPEIKTGEKPLFAGKAGPGRPKGLQNKTTIAAKDAIAQAADELGGAKRLVAWAKEDKLNERVFWGSIYPKLLPLQVTGAGGGPVMFAVSDIDEAI